MIKDDNTRMMDIRLKRKILIIEDNDLNRELLGALLEDRYDIMMAENGEIGLTLLAQYYRELSVVLLDVVMPVCDGYKFLEKIKGNQELMSVPIIVTTGNDNSVDEERCLSMGAADFVSKPYNAAIVRARIHSIIKLRESVATLSAVEYDELTGLLTMQAFRHHAQRLLETDKSHAFDLCVMDIQDFKLLNTVLGESHCDRILLYLADWIRKVMPEAMIARSSDRFFCMCLSDHMPPFAQLEEQMQSAMKDSGVPGLIFKSGIYQDVDHHEKIAILCDRALMAVSCVKHNFNCNIGFYDKAISDRRLLEQQMEARFDEAIDREEFLVWYQPKIDVRTEKIAAAEALVRWRDTNGNIISPGMFIPLFERDGLIHRLDEYVFTKVCQLQKRRMSEGKKTIPISVNLSRNSIYQPGVIDTYVKIVAAAGISPEAVAIELTESAATGSAKIGELTDVLKEKGFSVHMDDFGTGYSSLASLSSMSFDVIKLDKSLCDQIGNIKGDIIISHMIGIAKEMGMTVVAEGVEEQAQVTFLRNAGCDMIQGYYYSPPRDQNVFEKMIGE